MSQTERQYTFTEKQLLDLIKMAFDLGKGSPPDTEPLTLDWPLRILRHAVRVVESEETK
jgi:hypothetical protein